MVPTQTRLTSTSLGLRAVEIPHVITVVSRTLTRRRLQAVARFNNVAEGRANALIERPRELPTPASSHPPAGTEESQSRRSRRAATLLFSRRPQRSLPDDA